MLKIKGKFNVTDIELSSNECVDITIKTLCKIYGFDENWYIEYGRIYEDREVYMHKREIMKTYFRDAQSSDYYVYEIVKKLKEYREAWLEQ